MQMPVWRRMMPMCKPGHVHVTFVKGLAPGRAQGAKKPVARRREEQACAKERTVGRQILKKQLLWVQFAIEPSCFR